MTSLIILWVASGLLAVAWNERHSWVTYEHVREEGLTFCHLFWWGLFGAVTGLFGLFAVAVVTECWPLKLPKCLVIIRGRKP